VGAQAQYGYNLRNLPATITYPGSLNVTRGYDDAGRLTSVQDWLSNTTAFGYDVNSNLTTETLPTASGVVNSFTFDAADRLTGISDKVGKTTLFAATYTRDNANQLTSDSSIPSSTGSYQYNTLNQLCYAGSSTRSACSSPPRGAIAYAYDAADNLVQMGSTQQAFNNADELCWTAASSGVCGSPPTGATTYTYDTRGNRTRVTPATGGATNLSYDQANRLIAYGTSATYAYSGDGLRMSKTVSGTMSQFLWDVAGQLPALIKDGSVAYIDGPGGLPLEQITGSTALWLHHDQLGSTRLVTDNSGTSQATYAFDAYGNLTAISGTITNPMRFASEYNDSESGLYYLRARYYDPATGQFASKDALVSLTREPYAYTEGNPLNGVDPSGLVDWGAGWNALVGGIGDIVTHPHPLKDYASAESQLPGILQFADGQLFQNLYGLQREAKSSCPEDRTNAINQMALMTAGHGSPTVSDVLATKRASIMRARLPEGSPGWDEIRDMTMAEVEQLAKQNAPGFRTIQKLLTDLRFNK
jgi:RHS repeat-associated protein